MTSVQTAQNTAGQGTPSEAQCTRTRQKLRRRGDGYVEVCLSKSETLKQRKQLLQFSAEFTHFWLIHELDCFAKWLSYPGLAQERLECLLFCVRISNRYNAWPRLLCQQTISRPQVNTTFHRAFFQSSPVFSCNCTWTSYFFFLCIMHRNVELLEQCWKVDTRKIPQSGFWHPRIFG